ncbi:MAG TPA: GxxExxY protein [Allosphingosinicella sp.]|nr:GxxExxY protein [Allosphingosinicella sp.]
MGIEDIARVAVDCGFRIHKGLGPGLLESVYEAVLEQSLVRRGLTVERQRAIPISFDGIAVDEGFRADLLVEGRLLIELKSVERIAPVHMKQLITYLRLMDLPLGLLMNFGGATLREGVKRAVNGYGDHRSSRAVSSAGAVQGC